MLRQKSGGDGERVRFVTAVPIGESSTRIVQQLIYKDSLAISVSHNDIRLI